jgi:mono/diheme cytochrome c family protein
MIWLMLLLAPALLAQEPPAAARGAALFHGTQEGSCGTCHALGGKGTAVGPDLSRLARLNPKGIKVAILASRTQYVQNVKLKAGGSFPGMEKSKSDTGVEYYDLSQKPPALKQLTKADIDSTTDNASWKHPAESAKYTNEQLADIISYIRYASFGDKKGVTADDLE